MARVRKSTLSFDAITLEGSLLSSAKFVAVAERKAEEQTDVDYGIPKGLTLRDETARYFRIGQALFHDLHASSTPARHKTIEFTEQLLRVVFGFSDIHLVHAPKFRDDRLFPVTLEALGGRVPVVVVPPSDGLDHASNSLSQDRRRSAASALQDWLNADEAAVWGLCTNGESLRLLRDNESLTRPAYLEADLRQIFEAEDYAGFSALWLVLHVSRFGRLGALPADCPLERWRESGSKEGLAARDRLRDGVEAALLALGTGFLTNPANTELSARLREGAWPIDEYFRQLLRVVYRLIFLLAAEDRNLLHLPEASDEQRKLYAQGYSLGALRDRAIRRSGWDNFQDRWSGLRVTFRALANGEPRLALPALGGIFATTATPDLDRAQISNRFLMEAIFRLAWLRDDGLLMPVNWRDMETEELGSVYESLLELTPRLSADGREFKFAGGAQTKGNARKTSGSYYTPDSLVQLLLDTALDPVLDRIEGESEDPVRGLLRATVIDPACGSGHFLLAAARRIAKRVVHHRCGDIHSEQDRLRALRDVVRSCIYGVDRNPMAVELTKVALWIETVEPGKPLGFLDANIRCGDSLLGIFSVDALRKGIPDAAYKPLTGDDKAVAKDSSKRNKDEVVGQGRLAFSGSGDLSSIARLVASIREARQLPEDTAAEIAHKVGRFEATRHDPRLENMFHAADLYIAAFLTTKTHESARGGANGLIPTSEDVHTALRAGTVYGPRLGAATQIAREARAFHWPLEFPDIINSGGFDVVLGNPPWERIKLQEQEFFASRDPAIAEAPNAAARGKMIQNLKASGKGSREHLLFEEFERTKRTLSAASEFARVTEGDKGRFPFTGRGDVNTYSLFAELFMSLTTPLGQAGIIVPTGIATDATTAPFFAYLIEDRRLMSLHDFQTGLGFFDDIGHARFKFALLTICSSQSGPEAPKFSFFSRTALEFSDLRRHYRLTQREISQINPNTNTSPLFRSEFDARLTASMYRRVPILVQENTDIDANPWHLTFLRMFDMANDSGLFETAAQMTRRSYVYDGREWTRSAQEAVSEDFEGHTNTEAAEHSPDHERYLPLYEAKMIHLFDHRWATYKGSESDAPADPQKRDPEFEIVPQYWVPAELVIKSLAEKHWANAWMIGWRDICRSTDERTMVLSAFPICASNNKLPVLISDQEPTLLGCLYANLASLVLDFNARQKVGSTSLTYFYFKQFPVLPPHYYEEERMDFVLSRVLELSYTSNSMAAFARDLGYEGPPFAWDDERRATLRAELDAWYACAYGLSRDELRYILDPADVMGPDYPSETFRVLKKNELRKFGEYRTQRLILAAWERMERGELQKPEPYQRSLITSPPARAPFLRPTEITNQRSLQFAEADPE